MIGVSPLFDPGSVVADLVSLEQILQTFFRQALTRDEKKYHAHRQGEWSFHQTLAHVTSAAEIYALALQSTLSGKPFSYPGLSKRTDLARLNQSEIAARQHLSPLTLAENLSKALLQTAELAHSVTSEQSQLPVTIPFFNRPLTVAEAFAAQLSHSGLLHAAQLASPIGARPLWTSYTPDFLHRQLTRFFQLMTLVYWPERGGKLQATLQFIVQGDAGGRWCVTIGPSGGSSYEGDAGKADVTLWSCDAHTLCLFFTSQVPALQLIVTGKMFLWGNIFLATKMSSLFSPT